MEQNQDTQPLMNDAEVLAAVKDNLQGNMHKAIGPFNIVTLIFVLMIIVSWYIPVPDECGRRYGNAAYCQTLLPALLEGPIVIMSIIVGVSFIGKLIRISKGKNPLIRLLTGLIGVAGAFFIFIFGFIAGIVGATRTTGSV